MSGGEDEDERVNRLLNEAAKQYEDYLQLQSLLPLTDDPPFEEPVRTTDYPLGLVVDS